MRRLILASASPARLRLLRAAGLDPEVVVSGVDEATASDDPTEIALELSQQKANAVADVHPDALVLACDSVLEFGGEAYGKPATAADAVARWRQMRGRTGRLLTGHCIVDRTNRCEVAGIVGTTVHFGQPTDAEIDAYVATGEPLEVAGAFTLDGLSAPFIAGVDGDPGNVIGVSLPLVRDLLLQLGVDITSLWR